MRYNVDNYPRTTLRWSKERKAKFNKAADELFDGIVLPSKVVFHNNPKDKRYHTVTVTYAMQRISKPIMDALIDKWVPALSPDDDIRRNQDLPRGPEYKPENWIKRAKERMTMPTGSTSGGPRPTMPGGLPSRIGDGRPDYRWANDRGDALLRGYATKVKLPAAGLQVNATQWDSKYNPINGEYQQLLVINIGDGTRSSVDMVKAMDDGQLTDMLQRIVISIMGVIRTGNAADMPTAEQLVDIEWLYAQYRDIASDAIEASAKDADCDIDGWNDARGTRRIIIQAALMKVSPELVKDVTEARVAAQRKHLYILDNAAQAQSVFDAKQRWQENGSRGQFYDPEWPSDGYTVVLITGDEAPYELNATSFQPDGKIRNRFGETKAYDIVRTTCPDPLTTARYVEAEMTSGQGAVSLSGNALAKLIRNDRNRPGAVRMENVVHQYPQDWADTLVTFMMDRITYLERALSRGEVSVDAVVKAIDANMPTPKPAKKPAKTSRTSKDIASLE